MKDTLAKKDKKTTFFEPLQSVPKIWGKASEEAEGLVDDLDFPTSKTENWKYTRVGKLVGGSYEFSPNGNSLDITLYIISEDYHLLVFINGFYNENLSSLKPSKQDKWSFVNSKEGAKEERLQEQIHSNFYQKDIFTVLNTAYSQDGYVLNFDKGAAPDKPIHILNIVDGNNVAVVVRNLVNASENSEVKLIETFHSTEGSTGFVNRITEFSVKNNARIFVDKFQDEGVGVHHIGTDQINQEQDSVASITTFTLSGDWVRNNLNFSLNGTHCESNLSGLYFLDGKQHVDNHTYVYHGKPDCLSNELYKGVMAGKSTGVFNGKVFVEKDAQKTNAYQSNANVLLTNEATINSKPELEIYADDVKCSHGSTVGQLDDEALFYLRSRGIGKESARKILVKAFAEDVIHQVKDELLKEIILEKLDKKFATIIL